jgi:uncharacterized protein (UPF0128 family)
MSATPRPWKLRHDSYGDEIWYGGNECGMYQIVGPESCYLAACDNEDDETRAMCRADAELIVRAVNAHDVLVKALERLKKSALTISVLRQCGGEADDEAWSKLFNDTMNAREVLESLAQAEAAP